MTMFLVAGGTRSCAHVRQSQFQLTKLVSVSLTFRQMLYAENRYISVEMAYIARQISQFFHLYLMNASRYFT